MPTTVVGKQSLNDCEQLLQRAVIDPEFRRELLANPEAFGISSETELVLPESVAPPDMSFIDLVNYDAQFVAATSDRCKCTCTQGPITVLCDGSSK